MRCRARNFGLSVLLALAWPSSALADDLNACGHADGEARIAACGRAIQLGRARHAELAWVHGRRGDAYADIGDFDLAMADFEAALRIDPKYAEGYNGRGRVYLARKDEDRALGEFETAIRLDPKNPWPHNNSGVAYFAKGDTTHAIAEYGEAIRIDPTIVWPHVNRGEIYFRMGDTDHALADFQAAVRLDPKIAAGHYWLANVYREKGDKDRALAEASEAVQLEPRNVAAFDVRGYVNHVMGDEDRALADYAEAIRLDPNSPWPRNERATSYRARGEKTLALADYNEAIRLNPKFAYAYFDRGDLYRSEGDNLNALAVFEAALRWLPEGDRLKSDTTSRIAALKAAVAPAPAPIVAVAPASRPIPAQRRVALVIGNSDYKNAALVNPTHDADFVGESLRKIGFDVTEVKNADFAAFDSAVTAFVAKEDHADIALFYFAGHGSAINGDDLRPRNYLMTTSADMKLASDAMLRRDGVTLDEVINRISGPVKVTLAFVDACRNDPFHRGGGDRGFEPNRDRGRPRGPSPPTPPCVRVRTRRFG